MKCGYKPGDQMPPIFRNHSAPKFDEQEIRDVELSDVNALLNAKPSVWENGSESREENDFNVMGQGQGYYSQISMREALNISTNNPFNLFGGQLGPFWGKTDTLDSVEKALETAQKTNQVAADRLNFCNHV